MSDVKRRGERIIARTLRQVRRSTTNELTFVRGRFANFVDRMQSCFSVVNHCQGRFNARENYLLVAIAHVRNMTCKIFFLQKAIFYKDDFSFF